MKFSNDQSVPHAREPVSSTPFSNTVYWRSELPWPRQAQGEVFFSTTIVLQWEAFYPMQLTTVPVIPSPFDDSEQRGPGRPKKSGYTSDFYRTLARAHTMAQQSKLRKACLTSVVTQLVWTVGVSNPQLLVTRLLKSSLYFSTPFFLPTMSWKRV